MARPPTPPRTARGGDEAATLDAKPPAYSPDAALLTVISGKSKGATLRVPGNPGEGLRLGKAADNDLVLADETVSRHHARIDRLPEGVRVVDLGSRNGVFVGGARIKEALVGPGTVVRVGDVELLFGVELQDVVLPPSIHERFGLAVGASVAMRRIFGVLERIAPTPATVLFLGETGTGKDLLARSVHMMSGRGPFEVVDCGAIAGSLIESELFGHERGALTGAVAARAGAFERAAGGTIFLDEIGELPLELQPKLLRVLESREFRRVGGAQMMPADVRVVAGTTKNLRREVQEKRFRDDLYFRLSVVTIDVPPLRRRIDDIPMVAQALLAGSDPHPPPLPDRVAAALMAYDWPGNVRELRNVLERALHVTRATGARELGLVDFPPRDEDDAASAGHDAGEFRQGETYRETRARFDASFERRYVEWLLSQHGGNIAAAARAVQMDRNHLTDLARRHGLDRRRRGT